MDTDVVLDRSIPKLIGKDVQEGSAAPPLFAEGVERVVVRIDFAQAVLKVVKGVGWEVDELRDILSSVLVGLAGAPLLALWPGRSGTLSQGKLLEGGGHGSGSVASVVDEAGN